MKNINILALIVFVLLISSVFVNAEFYEKTYSEDKIKSLYLNVNLFDEDITRYSEEFKNINSENKVIPKNFVKAIIALESEGMLNEKTTKYNENGEIGLFQLKPFDAEGNPVHYNLCLESECMQETITNNMNLDEKRNVVKQEYANAEKSICCGIYILNKYYETEIKEYNTSNCEDAKQVPTQRYNKWQLSAREYAGFECPKTHVDANYVNYIDQLWNGFKQLNSISTTSYGAIRFTPSFSIKTKEFYFDVYDKLNSLINKITNECKTKDCVKNKYSNFEVEQNNLMHFKQCEEPEINEFNQFYDNLVNSLISKTTSCFYPVLDQYWEGGVIHNSFKFIFDLNETTHILNIKNNLTGNLYKEYNINMPTNFELYFKNITSNIGEDHTITHKISGFYANKPDLNNIKEIYFLKDYEDYSSFIFLDSEGKYILGNRQVIGNKTQVFNDLALEQCDENKEFYKINYFNCLDTGKVEKVYDWTSNSWKDSDETIKIKFAFALNKNLE